MKQKFRIIIICILFLAGLSLLLYPLVANQWNTYRQKTLMSDYDSAVADLEASGAIDYEAEMERALEYNQNLLPSVLPDAFANAMGEEDEAYMSCLNLLGDGMMGTVEIPKINITLPIYHGTSEEVLQNAAGHLAGSSLPVGGDSTHCVISAHRGLPSAALFTDLDQMEEGDHFLFHILNETLCYEVDQITVVEPDDTSPLSVEEGKDLATLMTCTPYGVNSHRLLVRGHRVPYEEEVLDEGEIGAKSPHTRYLLWVVVGLAVTAAVIAFLRFQEQKRRRRRPAGKRPPGAKGKKRPKPTGRAGSPGTKKQSLGKAEKPKPQGTKPREEEKPKPEEAKPREEEKPRPEEKPKPEEAKPREEEKPKPEEARPREEEKPKPEEARPREEEKPKPEEAKPREEEKTDPGSPDAPEETP